jgi:filamentous hemagglutinin
LENEDSSILSGGTMTLKSASLINRYKDRAQVVRNEKVKSEVQYGYTLDYYKDFALLNESDRAAIKSNGDMLLEFGALTNNLSDIQSGGNLWLYGNSVDNAKIPLYYNDFTHYVVTHSENYKDCKRFLGVKYKRKTKTRTWTTDHFSEYFTEYDSVNSDIQASGTIAGDLKDFANGGLANQTPVKGVNIDYSKSGGSIRSSAANGGSVDPSALVSENGIFNQSNLNAMFTLNKNQTAGSNYLIESRAQFVDPNKLLGSSYFLERIGYNPAIDIKRLGDNYVEQQWL